MNSITNLMHLRMGGRNRLSSGPNRAPTNAGYCIVDVPAGRLQCHSDITPRSCKPPYIYIHIYIYIYAYVCVYIYIYIH